MRRPGLSRFFAKNRPMRYGFYESMETVLLPHRDINDLSRELAGDFDAITSIGPGGPTDRQIKLFRILQDELAGRDVGLIRMVLTEEQFADHVDEGSLMAQKLKSDKKRKRKERMDRFLEEMEKFMQEIRRTFLHSLAVTAYYRQIKAEIRDTLAEIHPEIAGAMAPHVGRYKDELSAIRGKIEKYKGELSADPSAERVREIQERLHQRTGQIESIGERFKRRLGNLMRRDEVYDENPPVDSNLHTTMNRAVGTMGSEIGNAANQNNGPGAMSLPMMSSSGGSKAGNAAANNAAPPPPAATTPPANAANASGAAAGNNGAKKKPPLASWIAAAGAESGSPAPS